MLYITATLLPTLYHSKRKIIYAFVASSLFITAENIDSQLLYFLM